LRLVTEAEERLGAALLVRAHDPRFDLGRRHCPLPWIAGRASERAVAAAVAAKVGERQEYLGRERDGPSERAITRGASSLADGGSERHLGFGKRERLVVPKRLPIGRAREGGLHDQPIAATEIGSIS